MKINHIGIAVSSIDEILESYINLGWRTSSKLFEDSSRNVKIQFISDDYGNKLELIECNDKSSPSAPTSILNSFRHSPRQAMYHICYESSDLKSTIAKFTAHGAHLLEPPRQAIALENHNVCFIYDKSIGIVEFVEI